jgi:SAM-dependent methyltransferase
MTVKERHGHAVLDLESRRWKGLKIERLLGLPDVGSVRMLEIGTGSGGIAHYFGSHPSGRFAVDAVDVNDTRLINESYRFTRVDSTDLPFADASFDVVITNHVIEHVGDKTAQAAHLDEIKRVLAPGGVVYLAVPSRWMLVEPHYRLAFLSWWPHSWRSAYVRLLGRGDFYDCEPLTTREIVSLARRTGFVAENVSVRGFRATLDIEGDKGWLARVVSRIPDPWLERMAPAMPTHLYLLR